MKTIRNLALLLLLTPLSGRAEIPAGWLTNLTAGIISGQLLEQPVLVYYTASWCAPCRRMAQSTFPDPTVQHALKDYSKVALDIDLFARQTEKLDVRAVPTFKILTPQGDEVISATGYQDDVQFTAWLTNGLVVAREAVARRLRLTQTLIKVDQRLHADDPAELKTATTDLFDLCAARETAIQQAARQRLTDLVNDHPALLLGGLNHPRLATRITVANLLRSRFGDEFNVDPWESPSNRQKAVAVWQTKLSAKP